MNHMVSAIGRLWAPPTEVVRVGITPVAMLGVQRHDEVLGEALFAVLALEFQKSCKYLAKLVRELRLRWLAVSVSKYPVEEAVKVLCLWHSGLVDGSPVVEILEKAGVGDLENLTCQSVAWAVGRVFAGQVGRT